MIIEIKIPSPGESVTEVEIAGWLVENGDYVEKDQEIAEIESDKATLPLIAEESGIIEIIAGPGQAIAVGSVACKINTEAGDQKPKKPEKPAGKNEPGAKDSASTAGSAVVKGREKKVTGNQAASIHDKVKISPLAKKLMEEKNLSVEDIIEGLGRITREDVDLVAGINRQEGPASLEDGAGLKEASREVTRQRISVLRRKLSQRLVAVKNETAMLTTFNEVDMSTIIEIRKSYQGHFTEKHGVKLGFMSFFVKAVTKALKLYPNVNSYIDGEDMVSPEYCDIGIAVQTDKGLMVPMLRNTEGMGLADIETGILELAEKARKNRISIEDMTGGTFTITNGGVFGSLLSTPILNPPQSAILGMHNITDRPVAIAGKVEIRPMMYIALSYDHRIIDGRDSVGFLVKIKEMLEDPVKMLSGGRDPANLLLGL